ncbi:RNA 2'-O ribose methyltransferase substrate binding family protein, partial [Chlamydia psittaci 84-8471/1]
SLHLGSREISQKSPYPC